MMDKSRLKEETVHGTVKFPLALYKQETDEKFIVKLHWHEETEIIFLETGRFVVEVNMKKYKLEGPAFVFVGAGDIHSITGEAGCRENAVVFDMKMLSFEYLDGVQMQVIRPLLDKTMQFPQTVTPIDRIWEKMLCRYGMVLGEAEDEKASSLMKVKASLYAMLADLYENGSFNNMAQEEAYDSGKIENVKKVLGYIQEHCGSRLTNRELSGLLGMNEQYFCRYFKKITSRTPTAYINEVRIERAAGSLQRTNRKIIDIAMECGYDNMGYFIRRFKEQKGVLPSEYRSKSQNSVIDSHNG